MEYDSLAAQPLSGRILDVGGGRNARYLKHLKPGLSVESVNIDPAIEPTHLLQPGQPFPIADDSYDGAICLNTLEHVYDARFVLDETLRVLKPGAAVHISVPFIFRIHAHPDDYFRATPSWWQETLRRAGFARMELTPLVWGRYATAGTISGYRGLMPAAAQEWIAHMKDVLYARAVFRGRAVYDGKRGERIAAISPGWFITGTKAG
jgi:SAM-dependent methyltransferase